MKGIIELKEKVSRIIEGLDCDCKEFNNTKLCGKCEAMVKLNTIGFDIRYTNYDGEVF